MIENRQFYRRPALLVYFVSSGFMCGSVFLRLYVYMTACTLAHTNMKTQNTVYQCTPLIRIITYSIVDHY